MRPATATSLLAVEIVLTCLTRPSERPGHATITDAIRSKPVAPGDADLADQHQLSKNVVIVGILDCEGERFSSFGREL